MRISAGRLALVALAALVLAFTAYSARFSLDFQIYYGAGERILAGNPDVYPHDRPPPGSLAPFHVYRYPPVAALLFAPVAVLPMPVAAFLFGLLKLAALFHIVVMVLRLMGVDAGRRSAVFGMSLLGIGGYFVEEFRNGNMHVFVLWMITAATYLSERGKAAVPGFLLALGACFKLTPLIYVPYFVLRGRWLLSAAAIGFFVVLNLLPLAVFGPETGLEMTDAFIEITLQKTVDPHNYSIRGALLKYLTALDVEEPKYGKINVVSLSEGQASAIWWASVLLVGAVLLVTTRGPLRALFVGAAGWRDAAARPAAASGRDPEIRRDGAPTPEALRDAANRTLLEVSLWTTALLLASPHTQRLWFTSLFLPFAVMLALVIDHPDDPRRRWVRWAIGMSFLVGTLLPPLVPGRELALAYEVRSPYLFATVFVFGVLTRLLWVGSVPEGSRLSPSSAAS